jgi:hypothetical protein
MKTSAALALLTLALPAVLSGQPRYDDRGHDHDHDRDRGLRRVPSVTFFEHANFRGDSITLFPGDTIPNLDGQRFGRGARANDRISSIRIDGDAEVFVFLDSRFLGEAMRLTRDVRDLSQVGVVGRAISWNDLISSIRVEEDRRERPGNGRPDYGRPGNHNPPPVVLRPVPVDVEKIVRRAYQDVLQRDPDDSGMRTFRSRMIEQGWTEQIVRDSLRKSEEYRTVVVGKIVRRAYHELLGREPDGGGERHYVYQLLNRGWSEEDVRNDIRKSAEFRNRGRQAVTPQMQAQSDRDAASTPDAR